MDIGTFVDGVIERNPAESEFHQAVREVSESVIPLIRTAAVTRCMN